MKRSFEQKLWDVLLGEWAVSVWDIVLRTIWLALFVAAIIGAFRLMAWADTGSRDLHEDAVTPHGVHGTLSGEFSRAK
jgi:hypothetical protein